MLVDHPPHQALAAHLQAVLLVNVLPHVLQEQQVVVQDLNLIVLLELQLDVHLELQYVSIHIQIHLPKHIAYLRMIVQFVYQENQDAVKVRHSLVQVDIMLDA